MNNDYIKFHILGIIAHSKKQDDDIYELPPINTWTEEFCETLNQINYDEKIKYSIYSKRELDSKVDREIEGVFRSFSHIAKVEKIYISNRLPDKINYVRFTDCVILRENNQDYATQCADSIISGLSLIQIFNRKKDEILTKKTESLKNDKEEAKRQCKLIKDICALQAHFSIDNKRSIIGSDNYIFNELLQNANDRISDRMMNISVKGNELILSYNEKGFSAKDFLSISTLGNSGNIDNENRNNDNINSTGHKGTGFKSVYNVFKKVVIQSGFVECTLDDSKRINCSIKGDEVNIEYSEWDQEKSYFPVPEFKFSDQREEKTTIRLTFINQGEKDNFIRQNRLDAVTNFEESKVYYFLDNIDKFEINGELFDKKKYLEDKFYQYKEIIEIEESDLRNNPRWKDRRIKAFNESEKSKITILFPKKDSNEDQKEKLPKETCIYCTLPIKNKNLNIPFYINCPAFELEDGRNSISSNSKIEKWNKVIFEKAIKGFGNGGMYKSAFSKIFTRFAKDNPDIAYKYFPYEYSSYKNGGWNCLYYIPFLKTITEKKDCYELKCIKDFIEQQALFLPEYMYFWFKEKKGMDGFSLIGKGKTFVYYGHDFDYELELFKNISKMEIDTIYIFNHEFFKEISTYITEFIENKFFVERENPVNLDFEIEFLKKLSKDEKIPKTNIFKTNIYRWYLGKTICESPAHNLNLVEYSLGDTFYKIDGHNCIVQYEEKIKEIFGSINEDVFKKCFSNLRTKLYFSKDKIVNKEDGFLNDVLEKFAEKLELIYHFSDELVGDELDEDRKKLFESGKIVVKLGDGSFCLSDKVKDLFTSSIIDDAKFILKGPDWAKKYVCNLYEKLMDSEFYKEREQSFFEQENMLKIYLTHDICECFLIKSAINEYIKHCDEITSKERYLFESICKFYHKETPIPLEWDKKYLELIDIYNEHIKLDENKIELNSQIKFSFNNEKLDGISKNIKDKFNDKIDRKEKEKEFIFLGEKLSLEKIFEDRVRICNEKYKNTLRYCIGTHNFDNIIIVFGEESIGKMLCDLFDCNSYINSKVYSLMDCYLPNPLFKPDYDNWNGLDFNQIPDIQYANDKELKNILVQRFELKLEDKWLCFRGYGGSDFKEKRCPFCGGIIIAEASSLRTRYIQAIQGIHVPILICSSCDEAVKYTENIYFCDEDENQYSKNEELKGEDELIKLLKSDQNIRICFDMFPNEKKIFLLDMTLVHRLICLKKLKERKDSNEMYSDKIINNK